VYLPKSKARRCRGPITEEPVLSIALLKTLIAVSEHGTFRAAADEVCLSHAAVGQQMKRLESALNVSLFDRSQRTPTLNQLGRAIVPRARDVVQAYETILDGLVDGAELTGHLTLGAVPSTIPVMVPQAIKRLVGKYGDLHIHVVTGLSGDLMDQVERGALDVAILSVQGKVGSNMTWQHLADEELVLLTSPRVQGDDPLRLLREQPYIRHIRRGAVGLLADEWLSRNDVAIRVSMEMESLESVASMVSHGLGVSVVPDLCVPDAVFSRLRKIPLGRREMSRKLGILTRSDCAKMHLVDRLIVELQAAISVRAP
jgi:DNA-binding transcriptional LysR family regulator